MARRLRNCNPLDQGWSNSPDAMAVAARAWALPKEIFGQLISDHIPQEFVVSHPMLEQEVHVFSWNIMARALCRKPGAQREGKEAEDVSNNGLDLDETIDEYTRRLQEKIAPVLSSWIAARKRQRWVVCLQEAPGHPHLRRDLLRQVQAGLKGLKSAERASAFACTVTLWDGALWELVHCGWAVCALCTVLCGQGPPLRVLNCHLPLEEGLAADRVLQLLRESPVEQLAVVAGDLKLDLGAEGVLTALSSGYGQDTLAAGFVPGSCIYDWTRVTNDGLVVGRGQAEAETLETVPTASVLTRWDPLRGLEREEFVSHCINYSLQERVRRSLKWLSDEDLGYVGGHHFGDQAQQLECLQARASAQAADAPLEAAEKPRQPGRFGGRARKDFVQKHIHRKLQSSAAALDDEALWLLGQVHFSEQFEELQRLRGPVRGNEDSVLRRLRASPGEPNPPGEWEAPEAAAVAWDEAGDGIEGLQEWLQQAGLGEFQEAVSAWCKDMGAIWLSEVQENAEAPPF
ncbi:unnamed protein product [Effrenium voratum]|nr:unnamed protein product [Effrenium voratum]